MFYRDIDPQRQRWVRKRTINRAKERAFKEKSYAPARAIMDRYLPPVIDWKDYLAKNTRNGGYDVFSD